MTTKFDTAAIAGFGDYLRNEAATSIGPIGAFVCAEGMSRDGFGDAPSLLAPLGEFISGEPSVLVKQGFTELQRKMVQLGDTVTAAGKQYAGVEDRNAQIAAGLDTNARHRSPLSHPALWPFPVSELDLTKPDRPPASFTVDNGGGVGGKVLEVLNWIWVQFKVDGGRSFTDSLVEPLVGNPKSIQANGRAWQSAAAALGDVAGTMGAHLVELTTNGWQDRAAEALMQFAITCWKDGAAWVAQQVGDFIAQGFDRVGQVSTELAELAIRAIKQILELAVKLAARALPVIGWAWTAIESLGSVALEFLGIDIDNLLDDIMKAIELGKQVLGIFETIKNIVETTKAYLNQVKEIVDFARSIPELDSVDPVEVANKVKDLPEKQKAVTDSLAQVGPALGDLDRGANASKKDGSEPRINKETLRP
ncbi:hypothetical protein CGZ98_19720 [Enemella evansiae]|uniref:hypothetical protein n=1 Tax=Enemella evansiae TaxID=2016499 RepID=UPI000B9602C5|nr:hypothetical protein [Enemella evansiae]OYO07142.1 hypothetical protein CGZ98_19720 [Enemella evansiae]